MEIPGSSGTRVPPDLGAFLAFLAHVLMGVAAKRQEARRGQDRGSTAVRLGQDDPGQPMPETCGLTAASAFRQPLFCDKSLLRNTTCLC